MSSFQQWSTMPLKATLTKLSRTESGHRIGFRQNLLDGYSSFTKFHHFFDSLSNVIGHIYIRYLPSTHRVCFFQMHYGVPTRSRRFMLPPILLDSRKLEATA